MTNFAQELTATAAEHGDRPAVRLDDVQLNYAMLDAGVARAAGMLRARGIEPGDRVGMQLPNVPYFPVVYFGALRLGAIVVPMNPLLKEREVAYHLSDSGAKALIAWHGFAEAAEAGCAEAGAECILATPGEFEQTLAGAEAVDEVTDRDDDAAAVIIYTSGTTGTPKGATLTHANLASGARVAEELIDATADEVGIAALPLFHVFGMNSLMNLCVHVGGSISLIPRFEPAKALELIERDGATMFAGVPTMFAAMLHHPDRERYDVSRLRICVSGGAAMPVELLRGFEDAFECKVLEGYGLSETTGMGAFNPPDRERKAGSIGTPVGNTEIRIVNDDDEDVTDGEPGEIVMRGEFVMKGYWDRDEATEEVMRGGWFHTGDIAKKDEDGYFWIVDRKKDLIIRGGYNVYPREIEEALYEHPAVREAAVVGVPHESLGEEVGAAVALKDGEQATPDELRDFMKGRVAAYKYPRLIWIVDELPKGPTGKILKREIEVPEAVESASG